MPTIKLKNPFSKDYPNSNMIFKLKCKTIISNRQNNLINSAASKRQMATDNKSLSLDNYKLPKRKDTKYRNSSKSSSRLLKD
jgi:hypothetical protein